MSFKKLIDPIKESLSRNEMESPLPFQKEFIPVFKGGSDVFGIAPKGSGRTTSLVIATIQKLNGAAFEDAPRAVIFVENKKKALELKEAFNSFTSNTDLRVYCAYEEYNFDNQKEDIYVGVDVVIATTKRLAKLYFQSGINLSQLKILAVDDAEFIVRNGHYLDIVRISESVSKCQFLIMAEKMNSRTTQFQDSFMSRARLIEFNG